MFAQSKTLAGIGWGFTCLVSAGLIFSAALKLLRLPDVAKEFDRLGYEKVSPLELGVVELTCTILYLIPQTSILGAVLLTGYLGGAVATHVRMDEGFLPPLIMGVLLWLGIFLREPKLRAILPWRSPSASTKPQ